MLKPWVLIDRLTHPELRDVLLAETVYLLHHRILCHVPGYSGFLRSR
jgi:hypothetical protein